LHPAEFGSFMAIVNHPRFYGRVSLIVIYNCRK
jgi:hypothetical protein